MSFDVGAKVGSYEILERLGKGGMANVYKAYHSRLDRHVAIKVLHSVYKDDASFLRRFTREARVVARLEHTNIVPVYDFAEHEGHPYLVMRYIEGETLKERMNQGALSTSEILRIATSVATALDYAHGQGVLHRDIKPSNILLTKGGGVFVTDFGLARITQAGESTLSQDMIMGTPQYISPEQAKGKSDLDGRTDVYSFGIVLYELVTGRVPFQSDTSYAIIHSQIFDDPPKPSSINDKISPAMEEVLLKALGKSPEERYLTPGEMVTAFEQAALDMPTDIAPSGSAPLPDYTPVGQTRLAEEIVSAPSPTVPPLPDLEEAPAQEQPPHQEKAVSPSRRRTLLLAGAGTLAIVCACIFLFVAVANNREQQAQATQTRTAAISATNEALAASTRPVADSSTPVSATPVSDQAPSDSGTGRFLPRRDELRSIAELEPLFEADPDDDQLRAELALAYLQAGRIEDARALVREMFSQNRLPVGYIAAAERLLEAEQLELAMLVLEEGLLRFNNDARMQQMLMMLFAVREIPARQVQTYLDRLKEQPRGGTAFTIQIGEAYLAHQNGEIEQATRILNSSLENDTNPYKADFFFLLGAIYQKQGEPGQAIGAYEAALDHQPSRWLLTLIEGQVQEMRSG